MDDVGDTWSTTGWLVGLKVLAVLLAAQSRDLLAGRPCRLVCQVRATPRLGFASWIMPG
jgi:hypothetical protein